MSDNRINQLSTGAVIDRQTPRTDFGVMFARGISTTAAMAGTASAMLPGGAVISAAITQTAGSARAMGGGSSAPVSEAGNSRGIVSEKPATTGSDSLEGQRELMQQNQQWTAQYLALQNEMQRESREYNTISNILKVRHESAKTAINNIR